MNNIYTVETDPIRFRLMKLPNSELKICEVIQDRIEAFAREVEI